MRPDVNQSTLTDRHFVAKLQGLKNFVENNYSIGGKLMNAWEF